MAAPKIIIRGARQHNLKNIDVELPRDRLVVITGLSGSGKSTLAFDTLYAEGQRRYVESLSTYARQFLERMEKPDVDLIEGLSPAIAIEQKTASHNPRSTVGTVTEIYDFLRLLYARVGTPHCYQCGQPICAQAVDQMVDQIMALPAQTRMIILAPVIRNQKGTHDRLIKGLRKQGFARVCINGKIVEIDAVSRLAANQKHTVEVVVDRLIVKPQIKNRLTDSLELALSLSEGLARIELPANDAKTTPTSIMLSEKAACIQCGISYADLTPAGFSFNSPQGACPACDGLGATTEFDPELIVPNPELSLREGAITPWAKRNSVQHIDFIDALTKYYGQDIYTPFKDLSEPFQQILLHGSGEVEIPFYIEDQDSRTIYKKTFEGVIPRLRRRYRDSESGPVREQLKQYLSLRPCEACRGTRLNRESRSVLIENKNIAAITALSIDQAHAFFNTLTLHGTKRIVAQRITKEITARLGFLINVGLGYLTLDRTAATLSGGESQRIRLATQIGSKLSGVLYVLDEPSIGLHQRDNQRLLDTLLKMRDLGNTVLVVEHDEDTIRAADHVVDMGPGAGRHGGQVVFSGPPDVLLECRHSLTGDYLAGRRTIEMPRQRRNGSGRELILQGARANNLKDVQATFPLGQLICVTGVSGSGKSTLIIETLYRALTQYLHRVRVSAGAHRGIKGLRYIDKVVNIDQSPIGRTPRSNPGTYTGAFNYIRDLFARTPDARMRGYKPGRFSFNVKGGRCEACGGDGIIKIEMHFLPDIYVTCDVCNGQRYNRETLEVRYKGKNIAEVLDLTVNLALPLFSRIGNIRDKLQTLVDVGLGYIRLGQPATTLSGGEAQRIKLSRELSKKSTGRTFYILDEPTTGLHIDDVRKLLLVLGRLVDNGNTVVVIEHNLDVIKCADHIIDLGPEGGEGGGEIVATGTPEELARHSTSHTGFYLQKILPRL